MYHLPGDGVYSPVMEYFSGILMDYIEVPQAMSFEEMGLRCMALSRLFIIPDKGSPGKPFPEGTYWRSSRHFDDGFAKYPGTTLKERIEAYLVDCGVTLEEIAKLRSVLVEDGGKQ